MAYPGGNNLSFGFLDKPDVPIPTTKKLEDGAAGVTGGGGVGAGGGANLKKANTISRAEGASASRPIINTKINTNAGTGAARGNAAAAAALGSSVPKSSTSASASASTEGSLSSPFTSLRPGLSTWGRKISEFGKEVFSLEDETDRDTRVPVAAPPPASKAKAGFADIASGKTGKPVAPPLSRSGTAPIPSSTSTSSVVHTAKKINVNTTLPPPSTKPGTTGGARSAHPSTGGASNSVAQGGTSGTTSLPNSSTTRRPPPNSSIGAGIASVPNTRPSSIVEDVPGMGDEPVMCPFCEKPLPPSLIISQMAHIHAEREKGKRASSDMSRQGSAPASIAVGGGGGVSGRRASLTSVDEKAEAQAQAQAQAQSREAVKQAPVEGSSKGVDKLLEKLPNPSSGDRRTLQGVEDADTTPKASAESFLPTVQVSERAEAAAAANVISKSDVEAWTRRAGLAGLSPGVTLAPVPSVTTATKSLASTPKMANTEEKPIPLLPPPPPPAERLNKTPTTQSTCKIGGIWRRGSKAEVNDADESEESEDEHAAMGGYAKLTGPASPEREEKELPRLKEEKEEGKGKELEAEEMGATDKEKAPTAGEDAVETGEKETSKEEEGPTSVPAGKPEDVKAAESSAGLEDLRGVLAEVLAKVDLMSRSHNELSASHNSLLTSLKIARSNLVMAEANADMLEDQLRRAQRDGARNASIASLTSQPTAAQTASTRPTSPATVIHQPTPVRRSLDAPPTVNALSRVQAAESVSKQRPTSLIIPASSLFETGPKTGPATTQPSTEGKGMFGGFFAGPKKLPGGLGTLNIPTAKELQASAARLGDTLAGPASRPMTPVGSAGSVQGGGGGAMQYMYSQTAKEQERSQGQLATSAPGASGSGGQFFDFHMPSPPTSHLASPNPGTSANSGNSPSGHGGLISPTPLHATANGQPSRPAVSPGHSQMMQEFAKMRSAYLSSQGKMEAMAKELTDLKKGKIEMEAELETLSQALFEEANKMVADERRRRLEGEEMLKEVREEREVLRETIKVLGGQVEEAKKSPTPPEIKVGGDEEGGESQSKKKTKKEGGEGEDDDDVDDENWKPRDLDKHYEALRKTIHHVADGAGGSPSTTATATASASVNPQGAGAGHLADALRFADTRQFATPGEKSDQEDFTPIMINPVLELSPVLDRHEERNPWAEFDFSNSSDTGVGGASGTGGRFGEGIGMPGGISFDPVDPLERPTSGFDATAAVAANANPNAGLSSVAGLRRESKGLNLVGVDFGEGLVDSGSNRAVETAGEGEVRSQGDPGVMRRSSSA